MSRTNTLILISALALIALIVLQVKWLEKSRSLIEEQFNQKVSMALCTAVSSLDEGLGGCIADMPEQIQFDNGCQSVTAPLAYDKEVVEKALKDALTFYDVHLEYEVEVVQKQAQTCAEPGPFCCSLSPFEGPDASYLAIHFPGKKQYIRGRLWFMMVSSILILLFVSLVFVLANYSLLRQKKISQINVDFFNNMAHEFKTPLTNISLALKLIRKKQPALAETNYLQVVDQEAHKLHEQIERVLYLARMENGNYHMQAESVSLPEILDKVIAEMKLQVEERKGTIHLDLPPGDWLVKGDPFHLHNAFRNLIDNALKYSSGPPQIQISLQKVKEGIEIQFSDNGLGIERQDQRRIFQKFQRAHTGNRHDSKGFGLGLAYVRLVMELHRGFVRIISDLNKGSRFLLYIPSVSTQN